jgi:hypothetical protein
MFDLWYESPVWLRAGIGLILVAISTGLFLLANVIWIWGWVVGAIFLLFCTAGKNKGGYNF